MRVLDTHVLLWALAEPGRLDGETRATIESGETEVLFSAAWGEGPQSINVEHVEDSLEMLVVQDQ